MSKDFDQVAVVIDWLDACRQRDLGSLLDLYAQDASLRCECGGQKICRGRMQLEEYWRPRLDAIWPGAFGLEEIMPAADGVALDYLSHEGKPVQIVFSFDRTGKILQTCCGPFVPVLPPDGVENRAG